MVAPPLPVALGGHRSFVEIPATSTAFQLASAIVADEHVLLVLVSRVIRPDEQRTILEQFRGHASANSVALVFTESTGRVNVETSSTTSPVTFAAAAAVMRASWAWDEFEHIEVIVNGTDYRVAPPFDGDTWQALVLHR